MSSPADGRPPLPAYAQPAYMALLILPFVFPPGQRRVFLFVPVLLAAHVRFMGYRLDNAGQAYTVGCAVAQNFLLFMLRMVLSDPERDLYKVRPGSVPGAAKPSVDMTTAAWPTKLWWSVRLWATTRGPGWSFQVKNVPAGVSQDYPVWRFVGERLARVGFFWLLSDMAIEVLQVSRPAHAQQRGALLAEPLSVQMLLVWTLAFQAYWMINLCYNAVSIVAVTLHLSKPSDYPPIFGVWRRDCYTVRRFWGRCWHQLMRSIAQGLGVSLSRDLLGFRSGTLLSRYTQLYAAFAITGWVHIFGAWCVMGLERTLRAGDLGELGFFMGQAVAITVEDAVTALGKRAGFAEQPSRAVRLLGLAWTVLWFSWSLRDYLDGGASVGVWTSETLPRLGLGKWVVARVPGDWKAV
ncbi:MAG: hypothetical protein M1832_000406 [Thelocarpon impressellum]|nr:MAG: hypothetical protein M1832_000406 [Thelocarpon impressellum]